MTTRNATGDRAAPCGDGAEKLPPTVITQWLTPREAAYRARCGVKTIYREVQAGKLRAARIGGRRDLRLHPEWVDEWLLNAAEPVAA